MERTTENIAVQIGNIIANALLRNQSIHLPSVGSLYIDTVASTLNKRSGVVTPPRYVVKFTSSESGKSLVELIAQQGRCDAATAESVYQGWREAATTAKGFEIVGVGVITNKSFTPTAKLESLLNPEAQRSIRLKRRRGGVIWIAIMVVVCACVGIGANQIAKSFVSSPTPPSKVEVVAVAQEVMNRADEQPQEQLEEAEEIKEDSTQLECTTPPRVVDNPRYRLVYGVFSTMENAQKAVSEVAAKSHSVVANIRPYGDMYMVNVVESDVIEDCKVFMEQNIEIYPELWISKRRGE